jgi:MarR family transcriptional regulator, organic hydroperoxide resistance regulator
VPAARSPKKRSAKPRGSLLLDDQLCFALYAASRAVTQLYRPLLEELGLTYPQYLVMLLLWERGEMTIGDLADTLQLDYGTLSPMLKRLASAGLVERRRAADDERVVRATLTDAGQRLKSRAQPVCQAAVDSYGLDARQFRELRATLNALADSVNGASRVGSSAKPG